VLAVFGATGRTGSLVAEVAASHGLDVLLVGRDEAGLAALGRRLDRPWAVAAVDDDRLVPALEGADAVVNAAGPFEATARPVLRAALAGRCAYLDLSNDLGPVLSVLRADAALREGGISATPAVGFGTVATDGLARLLTDDVPDAVRIRLGMAVGSDGGSRGVAASTLEVVRAGGRRLENGELERAPLGAGAYRAPDGGPLLVPVGLADLAITPLTTGLRSVAVGVAMPLPRGAARLVLPAVAAAARRLRGLPKAPAPARVRRREPVSRAWAEVVRADGSSEWASLTTGDGFRFSAEAAVAAAERVLAGEADPGSGTASGRWGSGFLAGLPQVRIEASTRPS
jgi:hypothetical protein